MAINISYNNNSLSVSLSLGHFVVLFHCVKIVYSIPIYKKHMGYLCFKFVTVSWDV